MKGATMRRPISYPTCALTELRARPNIGPIGGDILCCEGMVHFHLGKSGLCQTKAAEKRSVGLHR
jgi:hypothetical protein